MSNTLKSVAGGAGMLFLNGIILYIIRFGYKLVVSRYLGPHDYGLLSLGLMVANVFALLATLGINNGVIKFIAHYRALNDEKKVAGTVLAATKITILMSAVFILLLVLFSQIISTDIFREPDFKPILIIFAFIVPLYALLKLASKIFVAFKEPKYVVITSTLGKELPLLAFVFIGTIFGFSLLEISFVHVLSLITGIFLSLFFLRKKFNLFSGKIKRVEDYKELLKYSLPLFFSAVFVDLMGWADTFFLGLFMDAETVGIYNIALPVATTLGIFLTSFSKMIFPVASEMKAKNNLGELGKIYARVARWIFVLSFPFLVFILLFSKQIISVFFGADYIIGSTALIILSLGCFVNVVSGPAVEVLKALSRVRLVFYVNAIFAVFNIILNIILIPSYGLFGAAIATALALALREFVFLYRVRKKILLRFEKKYYIKSILSIIMPLTGALYLLAKNYPNSFLKLFFSGAGFMLLYFSLMLLLKGISMQDKKMFFSLLKRQKV